VVAGVVAPLEGALPPLDGDAAPLALVSVALVELLLEDVVVAVVEATAGAAVGTVNCGTPVVSVPVPPPPQAASPTPIAMAAAIAGSDLNVRAPGRLIPSGPVPR
jgi:hypothetical protein